MRPPRWQDILTKTPPDRLLPVFSSFPTSSSKPRYLHWDEIICRQPPAGLTREEWWLGLKLGRSRLYQETPLRDAWGKPFQYLITDPIPEQLHLIDLAAGGKVGAPLQIMNPETRNQYYMSSLIEEAITSSQLEGATTTRLVAKEMIHSGRSPRDRSERMILNNFQTMRRIGALKDEALTPELVFELHRLVTRDTLDDPTAAGRFRTDSEDVQVEDDQGAIVHLPPPALELPERLVQMCDFANGQTPMHFVHPAIRAIILHFWLAYDHPFVDGNGRTARSLFYWSMLRHGFWVFEFISISDILLKAPAKYGKAFLYTETDDNDLTYFILHQIGVLRSALDALDAYIQKKSAKLKAVESLMRAAGSFNHRQRALLTHALRHPGFLYTTEGHRLSHDISYNPARADLVDLSDRGFLVRTQRGKTTYFTPAKDLEAKLGTTA
ncbi:MAG: Fic family protein [Capsulimonas sp.]|uniref:Fic family protein n=1 Tax=Capsulimonas sp. TaxID=2494211 RepID=UPI0032649894